MKILIRILDHRRMSLQHDRRQNHKYVTIIFRKKWKNLTISIKTERVSVIHGTSSKAILLNLMHLSPLNPTCHEAFFVFGAEENELAGAVAYPEYSAGDAVEKIQHLC